MYQQAQKRNTHTMLAFAIGLRHALELAEQQNEQDAEIMRKANDYADQVGVSEWHGSRW